jgi:hypothetical protein
MLAAVREPSGVPSVSALSQPCALSSMIGIG